jgi:hypothetical protein
MILSFKGFEDIFEKKREANPLIFIKTSKTSLPFFTFVPWQLFADPAGKDRKSAGRS